MSLNKEIDLVFLDNYNILLSEPIELYRNDSVLLRFNLNKLNLEYNYKNKLRPLTDISLVEIYLVIEKPNSEIDIIKQVDIENNDILFVIDRTFTAFLGTGRMQLVLIDGYSQIALTAFEYRVRENIYDN